MSKIMIVDDNRDIVETLKTIMEMENHQTEEAYNGEEFLGKVESARPDLVLLDVMMPGLKTKEILARLKERKLDLKIILVTVVRFSDQEKRILMTDFNIRDYITKPFDVPELITRVRAVL
ncbi:MAG: response regulator [Candidatus Methanoperedens sp.]|nr:response regulator [Candidatus Methanoperedens sp.]MCE8426304.1 response regulator [Candidatus Methanoperedens sp.]MCE8428568.1 response regulator [Candidatus Methanoperedens sp.]